ncbi:MAG: hypothetical protein GW903_00300 [Alphaproteobacteria bacterium]|nr:hypothetical protein [Alphaproteobacteria bacterium]NCQ87411.1 hypothetical protein [Alphaproteobacteria bacterium]NCT06282.1 hypothetical protein [Alphaproteobacteria bacterium]
MLKFITLLFSFFITHASFASDVSVKDGSFYDSARSRTVPYKLYAPSNLTSPAPIIIFSHGLGGSTSAAPYFGKAMAENGYYAFFIQHEGSDKTIWQGSRNPQEVKRKFSAAVRDSDAYKNRMKDLPFVIDQIELLNKQGALKGKLDVNKIGMAGHSYGAKSVLAAAGQSGTMGAYFKESRIKAAVALSPSLPMYSKDNKSDQVKAAFSKIDIPLFFVTGTKDGNPLSNKQSTEDAVAERILSYTYTPPTDKYLVVFKDAEHSSFGQRATTDALGTHITQSVSHGAVLFFDAYLKGNQDALNSLRQDYKSTLKPADHFEYK